MFRGINVQDAPPIMTDDEEAVEHAERNRWHSEEIHGRNCFATVSKEGQPALAPLGVSRRSFHPTGDGSLGKFKTEYAEFPMDPRRSPGWVLGNHLVNQFPNLLRRRSPSDLSPDSGDQPPVHTITSPLPADDGFGRHDEEGLLPSQAEPRRAEPRRADSPSDYPEELIEDA